jgi:uncharacterized protein YbbK (DUF523 family)
MVTAMILVSACLLGKNCKYSGGNNENAQLISLLKDKQVIAVCPEELGGLPTPRLPAEIVSKSEDHCPEKMKVCLKNGQDVTEQFLIGALCTKIIAEDYPITLAIMKERSPSCGVTRIFDGTFSGKIIPGSGITTTLLKKVGIPVISEETPLTDELLSLINKKSPTYTCET